MLEKLKNAIFGDPKEKQRKELEKIIKAKLKPVEAYLILNGNLWEHEYGRPYVRRLRDGFTATVFNLNGSWCCEVRNQYGNYETSEVVHNGEEIEKIIQKYI